MTGTPTATCPDCDTGWRGPHAHERGVTHEGVTGHTVWYDEDDATTEDDTGPFRVVITYPRLTKES